MKFLRGIPYTWNFPFFFSLVKTSIWKSTDLEITALIILPFCQFWFIITALIWILWILIEFSLQFLLVYYVFMVIWFSSLLLSFLNQFYFSILVHVVVQEFQNCLKQPKQQHIKLWSHLTVDLIFWIFFLSSTLYLQYEIFNFFFFILLFALCFSALVKTSCKCTNSLFYLRSNFLWWFLLLD